MGLFNKVAGVFGRIGRGMRKAFDWLGNNRDKITSVTDTVGQFIPGQYRENYDKYIKSGNNIIDKGIDISRKF